MTLITEHDLRVRLEQENLLHRIINSVRRTLDLQDILTTTVAEVRSLLGTDRVMIYKFHAESSGQVIAGVTVPKRENCTLRLKARRCKD